jgi:hypothetical protein
MQEIIKEFNEMYPHLEELTINLISYFGWLAFLALAVKGFISIMRGK